MSNRVTRSFAVILLLISSIAFAGAGWSQPPNLHEQVNKIGDPALRRVLANSVKTGIINSADELDLAVKQAQLRTRDNPAVANPRGSQVGQEIAQLAAKLATLDRDAIKVTMVYGTGGKLFAPLAGSVPSSYDLTVALSRKFNPANGTYDSPALDKDIDSFLKQIANDPCIQYALTTTKTTMTQFKANWFGRGNGFEHVLGGEAKGGGVSGYHFWYRFYCDEAKGDAKFGTLMGVKEPCMYTGSFSWDPDGSGPMPRCTKKKGGFLVGNSACAILALGHIAIETARKVTGQTPSAQNFQANINGRNYNWQLYTMNDSIRSLYPIVGAVGENYSNGEQMIREFYDLEEGMGTPAGTTIH